MAEMVARAETELKKPGTLNFGVGEAGVGSRPPVQCAKHFAVTRHGLLSLGERQRWPDQTRWQP